MAIDEGETITLTATFRDSQGNKTDPSTPVEVTIRRPDGTTDGPFQTNNRSTGVFAYQYTVGGKQGEYTYKFVSNDGLVEQDTFYAHEDKTA